MNSHHFAFPQSVRRIAVFDTEYSLDADDTPTSEKPFMPERSISLRTSSPLCQLALTSRLCNGAKFEGSTNAPVRQRTVNGDPTDAAVLRFAEVSLHKCLSLDDSADVLPLLSDDYKKIFEIPFNSRNKWMMSVFQDYTFKSEESTGQPWMLVKGAPEVLFPSSTSILDSNGKPVPLNAGHRSRLSQLQHKWCSEGQRVIAVCKRSLDTLKLPKDKIELEEMLCNELDELTVVGLISIWDPPRAEVKDAVRIIRGAGVRIFMVTGDFMVTAVAIARQVLIASPPFALQVDGHTYKLFRSESSHRIGMIPSIAYLVQSLAMSQMVISSVTFLGQTLAMSQMSHQRKGRRKCRFPCQCAKLLR